MADIVLIHGAWAGSWVWDSLQDGLRNAGHRPHAVDLPGNGSDATPLAEVSLERYVEHVGALIEKLPGPIQLVAHSGGGVTATAVAERHADRIAGVSYVAGMMLPSGMGFAELCAELSRDFPEVSGIGPYLEAVPSGSRVPSDAACAVFFHDAPARPAVDAARRLTVQPDGGRDIVAHWTPERFGRLPRLYLEATRDRSVLPVVQQRMQQLVPGAERVALDCGHAPQLAAPEALLTALLDFFARHPNPVF
ncbi:alpha/beta fold hydrolase [Stutzerimonas stutzeri]